MKFFFILYKSAEVGGHVTLSSRKTGIQKFPRCPKYDNRTRPALKQRSEHPIYIPSLFVLSLHIISCVLLYIAEVIFVFFRQRVRRLEFGEKGNWDGTTRIDMSK